MVGCTVLARVAERSGSNTVGILGGRCNSPSAAIILLSSVVATITTVAATRLSVTLPHTNVPTNSDSATLIGNSLAKLSALHQSGKLLGAKHAEGFRLNLHSEVDARRQVAISRLEIEILLLLGRLKQAKGQTVTALVANRQVGEDEVSGFSGTVEVCHTRGGDTGQDGWVVGGRGLDTAMGNRTGMLETGVEEEVGVVVESDILALLNCGTFNDSELDNGRRINWSSVTVGPHARSASTGTLWLLQNGHLVPEAAVSSGDTVEASDSVAPSVDGDRGGSSHGVGYRCAYMRA